MATKTKASAKSDNSLPKLDSNDFATSLDDFYTVYQETGVIGFDLALTNGKGLPVGSCVLMYSAPGSGKSTLCVDIARRLLTKNENAGVPYSCLFIDIEGGAKGLAKDTGLANFVLPERGCRLLYRQSRGTTWNDIEKYFKAILNEEGPYKDVKLVIIDSLSAIQSAAQADRKKDINAGDYGTSAKDRNNLYNKYLLDLKAKGVSFLLIAQQRQKQGASQFEDQKRASTADGDEHIVDAILKLSRSGGGNNVETKKVNVTAAATNKVEAITTHFFCTVSAPKKNRYGSYPAVPILMHIGHGVVNSFTLKNVLLSKSLVKEAGSANARKYTINPELLSYVGNDTFTQESGKKEYTQWIADHMNTIKDFLKEHRMYNNIDDPNESATPQSMDGEVTDLELSDMEDTDN